MAMKKNVDTTKTITHVSLCAGYGGIDLGLGRAIPNLRTVAFSEIEAFACANLVSKMESGLLDAAPIWTNLKTFPWSDFRDRVDILSGGYPCQPFSAAGKRLGREDPRHLWPWIADGIRAMRPRICFFENVEGHISLGLREVIEELEGLGYDTTWGIFSAREVGAPHQRKRVFILGVNNCERLERFNSKLNYSEGRKIQNRPASLPDGTTRPFLSNALRDGSGESWISQQGTDGSKSFCNGQARGTWPSRPGQLQHGWEPPRVVGNTIVHGHATSEITGGTSQSEAEGRMQESKGGSPSVAYSNSIGLEDGARELQKSEGGSNVIHASISGERHESVGNTSDWSNGQQPTEQQGWNTAGRSSEESGADNVADDLRRGLQDTSNKQRHNGTGNHAGIGTRPTESGRRQTEPPLGGDSDGIACGMDYAQLCVTCDNRTDELRLLGNGVVPATATRAFLTLMNQLLTENQ